MKHIILSADSDYKVYSVPDKAADHLNEYGTYFSSKWVYSGPNAEKYRLGPGVCYTEKDFIDYLNEWLFPAEKSVFVETLGWIEKADDIPQKYRHCPQFHF